MHQLSPFTCRRLSQLPRLTSVWECDRRSLGAGAHPFNDGASSAQGDCIMWADSLQGVVRGLSVVPPETGHEAIVRTLIQAIESPQGGGEPARPRKVVVCDREIQFFLRGALQDLDIPVEHAPTLPVIDEVFQKLKAPALPNIKLPEAFAATLLEKADLLWQAAPWAYLSEQEILSIELNRWEINTLYLSVLGLAGMEYGLLFYRDLDSLKQFRHKLMHSEDFSEDMQQAFLEQNCLFINFNPTDDVIPLPLPNNAIRIEPSSVETDISAIKYEFGSLHPLEGLRSQLAEEEAASLIVVLEALHRFFKKHDLSLEDFALQDITSQFRVPNPAAGTSLAGPSQIAVKVSTLPDVSAVFLEETLGPQLPLDAAPLIDDSVPEGALIMLGSRQNEALDPLREIERIHFQRFLNPPETLPSQRSEWPILTIQTTRPKAKQLLKIIQQEGGIQSICFNPGNDPMSGQIFQVGLFQTQAGNLHLFNEYEINAASGMRHLEKWAIGSAQNDHCCGCIIATGATGAQKGHPTLREVVAFFEVREKAPEELGLDPLVMSYALD